ncbi:MAG: hypothetical protein IPK03_15100 [Bacteroidetes bacterium]|nr:hypothetical protein [Bacteroidota bacterium]
MNHNCNAKKLIISALILIGLITCTSEQILNIDDSIEYPPEIASIIHTQCAISGCHNSLSYQGAAGLDMTNWQTLFNGSRAGAIVIPYRPDFSTLCYYTNTDTTNGITLQPTMPVNASPLSKLTYQKIVNWIQNGAPNKKGIVKFADYINKTKLYIANRGCDVITVMDPNTGLAMRYVDVGNNANIEAPCMIKVSPDKQYWYVIFNQGDIIQKFRTADNTKVGELNIGNGIWGTLKLQMIQKAFISDVNFNGRVLYINIESMQLISTYNIGLRYPLGITINKGDNKLYITAKEGNYIYSLNISNPLLPIIKEISLEPNIPISTNPTLNPYQIILNADESKYYITCTKASELRVLNTSNDSVVDIYSTGSNPTELQLSITNGYLFVSCLGIPTTNRKSSIQVFDTTKQTIIADICWS